MLTACYNDDAKHVEILLDHGGKIDAVDDQQCSALYLAAENEDPGIITLLIARTPSEVKQFLLNHPNNSEDTPLHVAANMGHVEVVKVG